jgi:hypothetical protein
MHQRTHFIRAFTCTQTRAHTCFHAHTSTHTHTHSDDAEWFMHAKGYTHTHPHTHTPTHLHTHTHLHGDDVFIHVKALFPCPRLSNELRRYLHKHERLFLNLFAGRYPWHVSKTTENVAFERIRCFDRTHHALMAFTSEPVCNKFVKVAWRTDMARALAAALAVCLVRIISSDFLHSCCCEGLSSASNRLACRDRGALWHNHCISTNASRPRRPACKHKHNNTHITHPRTHLRVSKTA